MKHFLLIILTIVLFGLATTKSFAKANSLGIYPPIIKIEAISPATIYVPITVSNLEESPVEVQISIRQVKFGPNGEPSLVLYKDYTPEDSDMAKRIELKEDIQTISKTVLSPFQSKQFKLKIDIQQNQKDRDFYFSVVFLTSEADKSENSHSVEQIGISSLVLLSIGKGGEATIDTFSSPLVTTEGNLKFTATLSNQSKHFVTLNPTIDIKNIFGKTIEIIKLKETTMPAGSEAELNYPGKNLGIQTNSKYFFGPYNATLRLNPGHKGPSGSKELSLMVLPGRSIVLITFLILVLIFIVIRVKKKL